MRASPEPPRRPRRTGSIPLCVRGGRCWPRREFVCIAKGVWVVVMGRTSSIISSGRYPTAAVAPTAICFRLWVCRCDMIHRQQPVLCRQLLIGTVRAQNGNNVVIVVVGVRRIKGIFQSFGIVGGCRVLLSMIYDGSHRPPFPVHCRRRRRGCLQRTAVRSFCGGALPPHG